MLLKKMFAIFVASLLVFLSACNLLGSPVNGGTNPDPAAATAAIQTDVANLIASTAVVQTAFANAVASTLAAMTTNTPEFIFTPSLTPTPTFTLTPAIPKVSFSVNTNCRSGPGTAFNLLGVIMVGEKAEIVGRDQGEGNWIIKLPSNPTIVCWVWRNSATVTGNTDALPVIATPPTPTPTFTPTLAASFNVAFSSVTNCPALYFVFNFQITNNGSVTWESNHVYLTDQVTAETQDQAQNDFPRHNGCAIVSSDQDLTAGEVGFTGYGLTGNPAGHSISATIRVCSQDGMTGTCLEKTITFTP